MAAAVFVLHRRCCNQPDLCHSHGSRARARWWQFFYSEHHLRCTSGCHATCNGDRSWHMARSITRRYTHYIDARGQHCFPPDDCHQRPSVVSPSVWPSQCVQHICYPHDPWSLCTGVGGCWLPFNSACYYGESPWTWWRWLWQLFLLFPYQQRGVFFLLNGTWTALSHWVFK